MIPTSMSVNDASKTGTDADSCLKGMLS